MTEQQVPLPIIPDGWPCLCNVAAGCVHTDECFSTYILPRNAMAERRRERVNEARDAVVAAAEAHTDGCYDDPSFFNEFVMPLFDAVNAYREAQRGS